jgi:hypothetical protein
MIGSPHFTQRQAIQMRLHHADAQDGDEAINLGDGPKSEWDFWFVLSSSQV